MQTKLTPSFLASEQGQIANSILRSCVHCGFCNATCPTYQMMGNELDGPRGRIYLMKMAMEGEEISHKTQLHLDRCLTCRACETTCPAGVEYGKLVDIGREFVEERVKRPFWQAGQRALLRTIIPNRLLFGWLLTLGRMVRFAMPQPIRQKIPAKQKKMMADPPIHSNHPPYLIFSGCVQPALTPNTNIMLANLLGAKGYRVETPTLQNCCGAVNQHLSAQDKAIQQAKNNIDAFWPYIEKGISGIIVSASGCAVALKDYGHLLRGDTEYQDKAKQFSALCRDPIEVLEAMDWQDFDGVNPLQSIAFHPPCSLQHGQKLTGRVEAFLHKLGFNLVAINNPHLCCGSAGTYSITQPKISQQLLKNKLKDLQIEKPDVIATANIGCEMHLATKAKIPVIHWLQLLQ